MSNSYKKTAQETKKRPRCSRISCCCMPVERVAFVFSVINAVICSLWMLVSIIYVTVLIYLVVTPRSHHSLEDSVTVALTIVNFIGSTIALVFAVLLCVGLSKKKPEFVLAYLVYGIVSVTVLGSLGSAGRFLASSRPGEIGSLMLILFLLCCGNGLYFVMLAVVYKSYKMMLRQAPVAEHRKFHDEKA